MGFTTKSAGKGAVVPQMNVTPLVDVVLVLLIIFMVITPLLSKQFSLQLPKQENAPADTSAEATPVVLSVDKAGVLSINGQPVDKLVVKDKVARMMAARAEKVLYFDGADDAPYAVTVEAMDLARQGGAKTVAVLTKKVAR